MSRIIHLNGHYCPEEEARVSVFDRGYLFADGVYEVTAVIDGRLIDYEPHMNRLARSLGELDIAWPITRERLREVHEALIERNSLREGRVYMQVTRGVSERDFGYPKDASSTLLAFTQAAQVIGRPQGRDGRDGDLDPRHPLEAPRHQVDRAAGPVHGQAEGRRGRRLRGLDA
jgi:D-alanine transaminase